MSPEKPTAPQANRAILSVVLTYAVFSALWIIASDRLVEWLLRGSPWFGIVSTLKGWFFVVITTLLLYQLMQRRFGRSEAFFAASPRVFPASRRWPLVVGSFCIIVLTASAISYNIERHRDTEAARLQTIADLKARQISAWLKERQADAEFFHISNARIDDYRGWRERGSRASRDHLFRHLEQFQQRKGYQRILLLDDQGEPVWDSAATSLVIDPVLRRAARQTSATGKASQVGPYRDAAGGIVLDFVATLSQQAGRTGPVVVLRADPAKYLFPLLHEWPVPSASAESLLFRHDGEQVQYLSNVQRAGNAQAMAEQSLLPLSSQDLLAAQVLRGDRRVGELIEGLDYRGEPALGVAHALEGTDWYLIAKMDRAELFAEAWHDSWWIGLAGMMSVFLAAAASLILQQRRYQSINAQERELQAAKLRDMQLLDAIVYGSDDCMFVKDAGGRYLLCNPALSGYLGKDPAAVLGLCDKDVFSAEDAERLMLTDLQVRTKNCAIVAEESLSTTGKGRRDFLSTKGPLHDADGKVIGLFGIARDITERKRSEETLRKLSLALEQSSESIAITDINANIEYVNDAFVRNTGYSREEVMGRNPKVLNSGKTPPETFRAMWQTLAEGRTWKGEFANRRKDGSEYIEFASISPIHQADGRITHYVAVKEDITEKKRLGEELVAHRLHLEDLVASRTTELAEALLRAEVANQAKSSFLANMSHEIRTPMNAIIGLAHLLRRDQPTPAQADRLAKVLSAAEHLLSIVNNILDLSKIDAGKLTLEETELSLTTILDNAASMLSEQAEAKGISLRVKCDEMPTWLRGDPTRLRQALFNLAGNAVKFTEQGSITLRARLLEDDGEHLLVRLEVEDTGIGIAADKLAGLFQSFVQADVSSTRLYGGTGLGLAITQRLARLMGGEAGVESQAGCGSTFWFTARLAHSQSTSASNAALTVTEGDAAEAALRSKHAGARLLLVEDNAVNREVALDLVLAAGLQADTAENGQEAVEKAALRHYDLILMDVQMPRMNGLDATRAIRAQSGGADVPVLAMTANAFEEARRACLEAGMNDFVAKPVNPHDFYVSLLKWLSEAKSQAGAPFLAGAMSCDEEWQQLLGLPGLDPGRGLASMRGNVTKYRAVLRLFADECQRRAGDVPGMLARMEFSAIEAVACTLGGNAALLGLVQVSAAAETVVSACREDAGADATGAACTDWLDELERSAGAIQQAIPETVAVACPEVDPAELADVLVRLEGFLEHGNIEANYLARDKARLLQAAFGKSAKTIIAHLEAFDYESASVTLRQSRASLEAGARGGLVKPGAA